MNDEKKNIAIALVDAFSPLLSENAKISFCEMKDGKIDFRIESIEPPEKEQHPTTVDIIKPMIGKAMVSVVVDREQDTITFADESGTQFVFFHSQCCCENVVIEDVAGDTDDLVGSPITMAESVTKRDDSGNASETWTFYKFATAKGFVTVRWHGESNGYYSEEVDFRIDQRSVKHE